MKKINALVEDGTENQFVYVNLYVLGAIKSAGKIFYSSQELLGFLSETYK